MTERKRNTQSTREDGRVILHVYVHPGVRKGIHRLAEHGEVYADEVLRELVLHGLESKGLTVPDGLREAVPTN